MSTSPDASETSRTTIAVIGAGRLGGVLARALTQAEFTVRVPLRKHEQLPASDIALLCVPDAEIAAAARSARPHVNLVGHVSGATPLDDVDFSMHPLQTFTGTEAPDVFHGIGAAIAGRTPEAEHQAERLARALGAHPFHIDDAHRAGYHAAASIASNLVLTVLDAAEQVARASGIRSDEARDLLTPLVTRTVENWRSHGAKSALTGPIARGDEQTVARQRAAITQQTPALLPLFDRLCDSARALATPKGSA
ncbi:MAG: hypothetical protein BGN97_05260 [Microbacterium sp. 69-10]|uniref:Rossmann-like and DUF2520 domain-containing protein n=1 Tax=Microbacterium sp. 69-10 TaxID=1895783 RepID=UPI0009609FFF|nr:Rossmann-like and DUF2520 domain-containing protein [Microbacterium sp. 69-10]OJU40717.1 MAG: hypothetical protein BGN97_05260 [Microbacterium sp. 69-10]